MKERKGNELEIVGTIPIGSIWDADFAIFKDGTIGEIHKGAQKRGLIIIKRHIKNVDAAIRMYLIHILSRYLKTVKGIKGTEVQFLGQLQEMDLLKVKLIEIIENLKKKAYPKEGLELVINEIEKMRVNINPQLEKIKRRKLEIGKWALRKAKILLIEKQRVNKIIENLFLELIKLYDICKDTKKINSNFKEFMFGKNYVNLLGQTKDLRTIKEHFLDYPQDLDKIREIEKNLPLLKDKEEGNFVSSLKRIINMMIPIVEGPVTYSVNRKKYQIFRGGVQCLTKKEEK